MHKNAAGEVNGKYLLSEKALLDRIPKEKQPELFLTPAGEKVGVLLSWHSWRFRLHTDCILTRHLKDST
jgi:hypothetical protein